MKRALRLVAGLVLFLSACAAVRHRSQEGVESPPERTNAFSTSPPLQTAPSDAGQPPDDDITHRLDAELDGVPGSELVMVVRESIEDSTSCCSTRATDWLRVYRREEGQLREVAHLSFDATFDGGTFDYDPGISQVRVERPSGSDRDLIWLRTESGRGGVDPRWTEVAETILRLDDDVLSALTCAIRRETFSGPWRSLVLGVRRRVTFSTAAPLTVLVEEQSLEPIYDETASGDEEPIPIEQVEQRRSTTYQHEGTRFVERGSTGLCETRTSNDPSE